MPLPEAKPVVTYRDITLKEILGPKYALDHDPLSLTSETATVAIADSHEGKHRYTGVAFKGKRVVGELLRQIFEWSIPKPKKVKERQTVRDSADDIALMDGRYPTHIELQMNHVDWVGPDWNGAWNLYDRVPFLKALRTLDQTQRDALFEREISALVTKKQAVADFPSLAKEALNHNFHLKWKVWDLLRDACRRYPDSIDSATKAVINSSRDFDDPAPFTSHIPKSMRIEAIDESFLTDIRTIVDTRSEPRPIYHKPNRNNNSTITYMGERIVMVNVNDSWVSLKLSDDGNHKKLGEHKPDPLHYNGILPMIVVKTDKDTGESDLLFDIREIPEVILDNGYIQASPRLGVNTIAASSPEQRDLGLNPVPVEYRGGIILRNVIEAQMPTYWCDPRNRALLIPSKLVQGIIAYGAEAA